MHPVRKKRLTIIIFILFGVSMATALALYALNQNINLYYTPSQVVEGQAPQGQVFRIGGIVENGSVHHAKKNLEVSFVLTDTAKSVKIDYSGVLPDLFREGQGIVVQGKLNSHGVLIADQVLAKHGAEYMPPPAAAAIRAAQKEEAAAKQKTEQLKESKNDT